ncbi:helix-turn-helix protein [Herbihabitans rhizosphaerae]|uniref:Helix-turn-helix protein n=2 Tax=Herbihabitans rhizosphaerae TaxID=1872711 RepID=A0A4Q7KGL7_9PSEU|nr:helix-turn-helix protein [Herbihabitans rhizosphaerae]
MGTTPSPTFRRRRLAKKLKAIRKSTGMTLAEAALALYKQPSALSRIEKGRAKADVHLVRSMMDLYDVRDDELIELALQAAKPGWWVRYGIRDRGYIGLETEATEVLSSQLVYIPGLLQTEAYMRALFASGKVKRTKKQLDNDVAARLYRQRRITDEDSALRLHAIIDESALRKLVGGRKIMRDQLDHVVMMAEVDNVTVQVLPDALGAHDGMDGAFTILRFAEEQDSDFMYVEYTTGSIHVEKDDEVAEGKLVFDGLCEQALSPKDSVALIERVAAQL